MQILFRPSLVRCARGRRLGAAVSIPSDSGRRFAGVSPRWALEECAGSSGSWGRCADRQCCLRRRGTVRWAAGASYFRATPRGLVVARKLTLKEHRANGHHEVGLFASPVSVVLVWLLCWLVLWCGVSGLGPSARVGRGPGRCRRRRPVCVLPSVLGSLASSVLLLRSVRWLSVASAPGVPACGLRAVSVLRGPRSRSCLRLVSVRRALRSRPAPVIPAGRGRAAPEPPAGRLRAPGRGRPGAGGLTHALLLMVHTVDPAAPLLAVAALVPRAATAAPSAGSLAETTRGAVRAWSADRRRRFHPQ